MKRFMKIGVLCLILLLSFTSSAIAATDPYEPNDVPWQATPLENPTFPMGQGVFAYASKNDIDFYKFYTPNGGLQVIYFIPPDDQMYLVAIYEESDFDDGHASSVAYAWVDTGQFTQITFWPTPGTYYIAQVMGWAGAYNDTNTYYFGISQYR